MIRTAICLRGILLHLREGCFATTKVFLSAHCYEFSVGTHFPLSLASGSFSLLTYETNYNFVVLKKVQKAW